MIGFRVTRDKLLITQDNNSDLANTFRDQQIVKYIFAVALCLSHGAYEKLITLGLHYQTQISHYVPILAKYNGMMMRATSLSLTLSMLISFYLVDNRS